MSTPDLSRFRRLAKEGSWIIIGQIISMIGALVLVRVLTEHLDPSQYGQLALVLTLGTLICQVAYSGSMPGIMRYYAIAAEKGETSDYMMAAWRMMLRGTFIAFALSVMLLLGILFLGKESWVGLTVITIIFSVLSSCNSTLNMIQNAARQRRVVSIHGSLDAWLKVLFALGLLTWLGNFSEVVVIGYVLSLLLILVSQIIFIQRLIPRQPCQPSAVGNCGPWMNQIWQYSKPFVFFNIFTWIQASSDRWALETHASTQDVGFYAVLMQLSYTPIAILTGLTVTFISPILFQRSGDASETSRNSGVHQLAWQLTCATLFVTVLVCFLTYLIHDWVFKLLVAADYRAASYLLPWMILAGGLFSAGQVLSLKLMSDLNTKALLWPKIITAVIGTIFSFVGAYVAGLEGVVVAMVAFSALHMVWLGLLSKNRVVKQAEVSV